MTSRSASCALAMLILGVPIGSFAQDWDWEGLRRPRPAFTIEFVNQRSDGTSHRYIEAYKSDGSHAIAGLRRNGTFVVDAVSSVQDRSHTLLHHDVMSKTTHYDPPDTPLPLTPDDATCETPLSNPSGTHVVIGKDVLLGLPVVKHIVTTTWPSASSTIETWEAPDLGCMAMFTRHTNNDSETGEVTVSETQATNITLGEPDPVWFEIPADYVEEPPTQIRRKRYAKNGWTLTETMKEALLPYRDEQYWRSQIYKPVK